MSSGVEVMAYWHIPGQLSPPNTPCMLCSLARRLPERWDERETLLQLLLWKGGDMRHESQRSP